MSGASATDLAAQIRSLRGITTTQLMRRYEEVLGRPTRSRDGAWLRARLARALAARGEPRDRRLLARAVRHAMSPPPRPRPRAHDPRVPPAGTWLRREHRGQEIAVKVLRTGFAFAGRRYRSLSAIAREVTGARWNGLLWFGLAERKRGKRRSS